MSFLEVNLTMEECLDIREQDGYHKGHEEGRIETLKEMAAKFKASGTPIDIIAENTGLTVEEIEAL